MQQGAANGNGVGLRVSAFRIERILAGPLDIDTPVRSRHFYNMSDPTTVFRARVPTRRLQRAERILRKLGLKPADALNILLAQIEIRHGFPFEIGVSPKPLLSADEQAGVWTEAFGAY